MFVVVGVVTAAGALVTVKFTIEETRYRSFHLQGPGKHYPAGRWRRHLY
jgi:hypothetical protein